MDKYFEFEKKINDIKKNKLFRQLKNSEIISPTEILINNKKCLNFSSNNYLGLGFYETIELKTKKTGNFSSRLVCGNSPYLEKLEKFISEWKQKESCLIFNSGFQANYGIIASLASKDTIVFADKLCHASIIDGILQSRSTLVRYQHNDMLDLEKKLKKHSKDSKKKIIVTESLFSMFGDYSPIDKIIELAESFECLSYIDEAHSTGFIDLDKEYPDIYNKIDIIVGSFGKSFAGHGAYILSNNKIRDFIINNVRSFIYTTAISDMNVEQNLKHCQLVKNGKIKEKITELFRLISYTKSQLKKYFNNYRCFDKSPIISIIFNDEKTVIEKQQLLEGNGIFTTAIRSPTVAKNQPILRITLNVKHTKEHIDKLINILKN